MRALAAAFALGALAVPAMAQERAEQGSAAILRALDKVNGRTVDKEVPAGSSAEMLGLNVSVGECRYPADNPTGDAYAYLRVQGLSDGKVHFEGWMVASSPALSALDHNRYDVWVIRCSNS